MFYSDIRYPDNKFILEILAIKAIICLVVLIALIYVIARSIKERMQEEALDTTLTATETGLTNETNPTKNVEDRKPLETVNQERVGDGNEAAGM